MYVDDLILFQCGAKPREVLVSMQLLLNSWGKIVTVTGGKVEIDKSWWYLVDFVWKRKKWISNDAHDGGDIIGVFKTSVSFQSHIDVRSVDGSQKGSHKVAQLIKNESN